MYEHSTWEVHAYSFVHVFVLRNCADHFVCCSCMEFQSGQNCVTEIEDMLCAKYIKTLCYIENIETSCAKYTNVTLKMQRRYAQNAETLCSKCTTHAQNAETLCSKCTKLVLKMRKRYAQNAQNSCSKCGNVMLKAHKTRAQNEETLCSQCTKLMLKMRKRYACSKCGNAMHAQNAETLCSKMRKRYACSIQILKQMRKRYARSNAQHYVQNAETKCRCVIVAACS